MTTNSRTSHRPSFSRLSLDFQRQPFSEHAYEPLLELLSQVEPTLKNISRSSPLIQGYLSRLTSSTLSSISQEYAALDEEKKDLEHQLSRLTKREYHSFVATAGHGDAIASAFEGFDVKVANIQNNIPSLENAITQFNTFAKSQLAKRERAQNLLANHDRLLDILEMPSLVSTCVKNGYFSEAIQLSAHVKRLASLHYTNVLLVQELAAQVETAMEEMTVRLVTLLREPLKLPSALKVCPSRVHSDGKIIGYLRTTTSLTESSLRYIFLHSRWTFLLSLITNIDVRNDNSKYLKQYFELMREHLFAIFTQYRSIFGEEYDFSANLKEKSDIDLIGNLSPQAEIQFSQRVLPSFALNITDHIDQTLRTYLPAIPEDDRQIRQSLLTQLLYCAHSLARVGCDFTEVVLGAFFEGADIKEEEWVWEVTSAHRQRIAKLLQTAV